MVRICESQNTEKSKYGVVRIYLDFKCDVHVFRWGGKMPYDCADGSDEENCGKML